MAAAEVECCATVFALLWTSVSYVVQQVGLLWVLRRRLWGCDVCFFLSSIAPEMLCSFMCSEQYCTEAQPAG